MPKKKETEIVKEGKTYKSKPKEAKKVETKKAEPSTSSKVELNAKRIDTLSKGMDVMKDLLDRVANRLGLQ